MTAMADSRPAFARKPLYALAGVTLILIVVLPAWNSSRTRDRVATNVRSELRTAYTSLVQAADSTRHQLVLAQQYLAWMEERAASSSFALIQTLSSLSKQFDGAAGLTTVEDLAATGALSVLSDATTRQRLLVLDRQLRQMVLAADPIREHYLMQLEQWLPPGMWRLIMLEEQPSHFVVDYRATLADLNKAGFQSVIRTRIRGLQNRASQLDALAAEAQSLFNQLSGVRSE